ncbi:MAG: ribosome small subunit-dependent GTPase A [Actinobacteria bacterium]|nr:ribosome small subunit-dependent GTPase A [Actinomycetota bacterium]
MVVGVDRGRITCVVPDGAPHDEQTQVVTVKARQLGRKGVVIGDKVRLVGDLSGRPDTLARLVELIERSTTLMRTADDTDPVERIIVANADQLAIVTATANPEPRVGLIDRTLVAAFEAGLEPILILTKTDLKSADELLSNYSGMDLKYISVDQTTQQGIAEVRQLLLGHTTVFIGHSGVGKSTLVNALVPTAQRITGIVNDVTGRGRHTSTSAQALALPDDTGWVIDTPGLRSFGLAHVDPDAIIESFPELVDGALECPRACTHVNTDGIAPPDCALDAWVSDGNAGQGGLARLDSLRRLLFALQTPSS